MIRKRVSALDDRIIHRLIVEQLVPFSKNTDAKTAAAFTEIRKRLNHNSITLVAAKGTRKPFGFISVFRKSRVLFIDMLAVEPNSQSRGWGKQLMRAAEAFGKAKGCNKAELFVDDSNPKAFMFYVKQGYRTMQYLPHLGCYLLAKPLQ